MLDGTYYFECSCGADEHTLRFVYDKDEKEIYTSIFLNNYHKWYERVWSGLKYIFGYKCKYGHWDCWIMRNEDLNKMKAMIKKFEDDQINS